ncbi:hypothetical protein BV898_05144 [Hypsibius exemplaris]|uniref:Uncharacterized protein n=1 Tax=Hypsibius exemplaris TaxID=2072580 RepID=A0A1W0X060_HYPEX|nr:hypothetical protein BV898_05144 [Hypsibius exemplaris]
MYSKEDLEKLTNAQLASILFILDQPLDGDKPDWIARILVNLSDLPGLHQPLQPEKPSKGVISLFGIEETAPGGALLDEANNLASPMYYRNRREYPSSNRSFHGTVTLRKYLFNNRPSDCCWMCGRNDRHSHKGDRDFVL